MKAHHAGQFSKSPYLKQTSERIMTHMAPTYVALADEPELTCEECGAKLTGEEGIKICLPCQNLEN